MVVKRGSFFGFPFHVYLFQPRPLNYGTTAVTWFE